MRQILILGLLLCFAQIVHAKRRLWGFTDTHGKRIWRGEHGT